MLLFIGVLSSFLFCVLLVPISIRLFRSVNVLDRPDSRKIHSVEIPSMGGIPIFLALVLGIVISNSIYSLGQEKYLLLGALLIFLLGVRDDLSSLQAKHKLLVQLFAAFIVVQFGGVEIQGLHGLFGIEDFPSIFNQVFTISVIVVMTNAFNLIDGIDGLAGSIGLIISLFFGLFFFFSGAYVQASIALSLLGGILGFLVYNWYPSKVLMGDTGSMLLGFLLTIFTVEFLQVSIGWEYVQSPIAISLALFALPVYDTLRVFLIRFFSGKNPLAPDRNHIHHVLLKLGYNHGRATSILILLNLIVLFFVSVFQSMGDIWLTSIIFLFLSVIGYFLDRKVMRREAKRKARLADKTFEISKSA